MHRGGSGMFGHMLVQAREFKVTVPTLLFDPAIFVFDFAANAEYTKFLVVDELMLDRSPFVDIRFEPLAKAQFWVNTSDLFALEARHDVARPQPAFIFHHAFVCSTLLARCLNQIDAFFSLKEPWILRRLADHKRANGNLAASPRWREWFNSYVQLMCRDFSTGRTPVIKATNVANNLLTDVLRFMPGCPVLYLYCDLESFLVSNLKKPDETRQKIPALARGVLGDGDFMQKHADLPDVAHLNFLQVCGLYWLVSLYNFRDSMRKHPNARARTLDVGDFLGDPARNLGLVSRHFGHEAGPSEVQGMVDARVMQTNAKDQSAPYGIEQRQAEMNRIRSRHERELKDALAWIDSLAEELEVSEFLRSHRLVGG
jgi:hypothetical protein